MPGRRSSSRLREGEEIPISVLRIEQKEEALWISSVPVYVDEFPPCIRNMISSHPSESGRHRRAAILAAFLGQAGWDRDEAKTLWKRVVERSGISEKIFGKWFQGLHCPLCATMMKESKGYPAMGIAGLGYCVPDKKCSQFNSPVEYAAGLRTEEDWNKGIRKTILTSNIAHVFNWLSGREIEIELTEYERKGLEALLAECSENRGKAISFTISKVRGRFQPKFLIRQMREPSGRLLSEII